MAVTLQQIADKAGVSRGTVDRALNNRGRINPEVAQRIKSIADEMSYQPNRVGRALALSKHSIKIGVVVQATDTPFMKILLEGALEAKAEVERFGVSVIIKKIPDVDTKKALKAVRELEKEGCAGIAVVPVEDSEFKKQIDELGDKNIPVVTFNSDIEGSKRMCFVGQDTFQSGKVAAGLMSEIIRPNGIVQVISGYPSNLAHKNRTRGFISELTANRKDIQILDVQYAFDDDKMAERIVQEMLKEYRDLAGIYITASGVEGVCQALRERDCIGKVKVISNDLTPKNREELKNGSIQFLLGQNAYAQGYDPIMLLFNKLFDGKEPEREYLYTEIVIKTKYNC